MRLIVLLLLISELAFSQNQQMLMRTKVAAAPPEIVTDGLVLHLDAGKAASYPGSGTTWYDLSGNNNDGTLVNGVGYSTGDGGTLTFDGVNDYVSNFPTQFPNIGSKTVFVYFITQTTIRKGLVATRGASGSPGWAFVINRTNTGNLTMFHTGGSTIEVPAGIQINTWYQACFVYDSNASTAKLYLNGQQIGTTATSFSTVNSSPFNGIIGAESENIGTSALDGKIAQVLMYNRALSGTEIQQNFNATKDRFGL